MRESAAQQIDIDTVPYTVYCIVMSEYGNYDKNKSHIYTGGTVTRTLYVTAVAALLTTSAAVERIDSSKLNWRRLLEL